MDLSTGILGLGAYLPQRVVTNEEVIANGGLDTTPDWIYQKIGIRERRIAAPGEAASDLAIPAARAALEDARVSAREIDLIIATSMNFDHKTPATAALLQHALGAPQSCASFDLGSACSGFVSACAVASKFLRDGQMRKALVVATEHNSSLVSWQDRTTCVYFGDGAGAAVIGPVEKGAGFLSFDFGTDGSGANAIIVPGGGSRMPANHDNVRVVQEKEGIVRSPMHFTMQGREVYDFVQRTLPCTLTRVIRKAGMQVPEIDFFVLHQANRWMVGEALRKLDVPESRTYFNIERYGNMASASIPVALCEARNRGLAGKPGQTIALSGFGAGLAWASAVLRWPHSC